MKVLFFVLSDISDKKYLIAGGVDIYKNIVLIFDNKKYIFKGGHLN